jgi:OOP family OmpA-OmpF porin
MESVMDMAQGLFGGDTLSRVSAWLHETPASTKAAVRDALPASVIGLANQAASEEGSRALLGRFQRGDYPHLDPEEVSRAVADPETTEKLVQSNRSFMEAMFGGKLGSLVDGMAEHAGVSRAAISKVLALAGPVVLGMIGKRAVSQNLDAGGLRNFLGEQQRMATKQLPGSLTRLLVPTGAATTATAAFAHRRDASTMDMTRPRAFPWWLVGLLAAIAVIVFAWGRRHRTVERSRTMSSETAVVVPMLSAGSVSPLSSFLDGNIPVPQRFVLQDLRVVADSAEIEPGTAQVLDDVARVLTAHGTARVRIEGHTDATGAPQAAKVLSQQRADTVKQYLTAHGIDAERIETAGFGADRPMASNDTPGGRAANRRIELVVLSR